MPFLPLDFPPGVSRNGTLYEQKGRWYDANLVRWTEGAMQPVGGWDDVSADLLQSVYDITYLDLPGTNDNYADTPDAAALDITGDIDLRAAVALDDWTPASFNSLIDKNTGLSGGGYNFGVFSDGKLRFVFNDGSGNATHFSTAAVGASNGELVLVRVTMDVDNGSSQHEIKFFTRTSDKEDITRDIRSDTGWTQLGDTITVAGTTSIATNSKDLDLGASDGGFNTLAGRMYAAVVMSAINGTIELDADFTRPPVNATSFTEYSTNGATVTINQSGSPQAEIVADTEAKAPVLGMFFWTDNDGDGRLVVGTPRRLFSVQGLGSAITPTDFDAGEGDAVQPVGATPRTPLNEAQSWLMDNFGEDLVALAHSDGRVLHWNLSGRAVEADASAPDNNRAVVVTPERFLVALGAGGDPRKVQWADQESLSTWTPAVTNQAGDFILPGTGALMMGRRTKGETLLWTSEDLFVMRYIGGTLVYSFEQRGSDCGPVSRRAEAIIDSTRAIWMGERNFFLYNGYVEPVPCEVSEYVFGDINRDQESKIFAHHIPEFYEVRWFYPSDGSTEIDRYVAFNYVEGHWSIGNLHRTAGVPKGDTGLPMMADKYGAIYDHETGTSYLDEEGAALDPFAESGPIELGAGDRWMHILGLIPDEATLGDVQVKFLTAPYPTASETTEGPYTLTNPTDVRISGRQIRMRVEQVNPEWRVGNMRLDVRQGERR